MSWTQENWAAYVANTLEPISRAELSPSDARCDCEHAKCRPRHKPGGCHYPAFYKMTIFGLPANLCPMCLSVHRRTNAQDC